MQLLRSLAWLALPTLVLRCGGTVETSTQPGALPEHDAATSQDAASEPPPVSQETGVPDTAVIDVAPGEFCSGEAKVRVGGKTIVAPLTTSLLIMDCCEGAVVRFHTSSTLGFVTEVMIRGYGQLPAGHYVLGDEPGGPEVSVGPHGQFGSSTPATGTLHVDSTYPDPFQLGFCIETEGDSSMGAMRLFVPSVGVAPYEDEKTFRMYLLADPTMTADKALAVPIGSLGLATEPIVTLMSLAWYEQSTHTAHWDSWWTTEALLNQLPNIGVYGLPFVVEAQGERVYVGAFMTMASSVMIDAPTIMKEMMTEDGFRIEAPYSAPDPRSDPRILSALSLGHKLVP